MKTRDITHALDAAAYRIGTASAVTHSIIEAIPCGEHVKPIKGEIDRIGYLATAVNDLLGLLKQDIEQLEIQLRGGNA
jgi:hypothetical protein